MFVVTYFGLVGRFNDLQIWLNLYKEWKINNLISNTQVNWLIIQMKRMPANELDMMNMRHLWTESNQYHQKKFV